MNEEMKFDKIFAALSKAQGDFQHPPKNKHVKMTLKTGRVVEYFYAELKAVLDTNRVPLKTNGLGLSGTCEPFNSGFIFSILLTHESGQYLKSSFPINTAKSMQEIGGDITYLTRYLVDALLGVTGDDDLDAAHSPNKQNEEANELEIKNRVKNPAQIEKQMHEEEIAFENFESLPKEPPQGRFKVPESVQNKISSGDTEHRDGESEHKWNANKKYPGSFYCSKKLVDGNFCREQRHEP